MNEDQTMDFSLDEEFRQEQMMSSVLEALEEIDPEKASQMLDDYESEYGQDDFWHLITVDIAEQKGDPQTMLEAIHQAEHHGVDDNELALRYGRFCYMVGRTQEALEYLEDCHFEEDSDQEFNRIHLEAYCHLINEDYAKAVEKLEDLLLDTEDYRLFILAAMCYSQLGKDERAYEYMERGLDYRHEFPDEYAAVLEAYDYNPKKIFAHARPVLAQLAGTKADDTISFSVIKMMEAMDQLAENTMSPQDFQKEFGPLMEETPRNPMEAALQALWHEFLEDDSIEETWRRVIDMPWEDHASHDVLYLYFRLIALERIHLSQSEREDLLLQMWKQQEYAFIRTQLLVYAGDKELHGFLEQVLNSSDTIFMFPEEKGEFELARAKGALELGWYAQAIRLVENLWDTMQDNPDYLVVASSSAVISGNEELLLAVAKKLMPHGFVAFHMLEFYDAMDNPRACREVQRMMKEALNDPDVEVPEEDFYRRYLKTFQARHRR